MLSVDQESHTTTPSPDPNSNYPTSPCTPPPPLPASSEVDLPTPPPNFSIRDYVLASRSRDIKNNWPFSSKSLRLCLKHGVKDVLPPFLTLDKLRDQSFETCTVGTSSPEKNSAARFEEAHKPVIADDVVPDLSHVAPLNKKLAESCLDVSSCKAGEDIDFPSTITSVSQSEFESIVPDKRQSRSVPSKRGTSLKASCEVEAAGSSPAQKTESTSRPLGRKCRLVVKLGVQSGRSSIEDISSNCASNTATEAMASKVCPVCKTFSSSSNTTLNAHIDQCLSTESTSLWTAGSKLARHRIKPRRMRLMVDIYASAKECTLEDLDRRNGTNWSLIANLPTQETEKTGTSVDRRKQSMLPLHQENASGDVGPVYIDANGTKVRILSKLNSPMPPATEAGNDMGGNGPFNVNKCISKKKNKRIMQKHQKYLKLASQSKKCFSHKVQGFQMVAGQKVNITEQMDGEDAHQVAKSVQSADSGTFKPWLCSKRRDFAKKIRSQVSGQTMRCKWHLPQHLLVDHDQSFPGGSVENHGPEIANFPKNVLLSSEIHQRKEKRFHNAQVSHEEVHGRKRAGRSLGATKMGKNVERLFVQMKRGTDQLSKDRTLIKGGHMLEHPVSAGNRKSSPGKKLNSIQKEAFYVAVKTTGSSRAIVTKARRFSSFRKNILSVGNRCSNTKSGHSKIKKAPAQNKSLLQAVARKDDQMAQYSGLDQEPSFGGDLYKDESEREDDGGAAVPSLGRVDVMENGEEKAMLSTSQKEHMQERKSPRSLDHYAGYKGANASVNNYECGSDCPESNDYHVQTCGENVLIGPSSMDVERRSGANFAASEVYLPGPCIKVPMAENFRGRSSGEALKIPGEAEFDNDQHMFCGDEAASDVVEYNTDLPVTIESEAFRENSFPEVDPIPIPGPPGSYLPSPRGMSSEDFQGNSSLTTSRVQSSVDLPEVVDGDSSDSPISIASTISDSIADGGKFDLKYFDALAGVRPMASPDRIGSGSAAAGTDPSMRNGGPVPQITSLAVDKPSYIGEYSKLNSFSIQKGSLGYESDQPCCCQRKEKFTRDVCLNHGESQLLRRRRLSSLTFPATEKQVGQNAIASHPKLDRRPEFVPHATSESENLARSMPDGSNLSNDSPHVGTRLLARVDCDSASPASNPILRLMGKNLMVVNQDEESSIAAHEPVQTTPRTNPSISLDVHQSCQLPSGPTVSPAYHPHQSARGFHCNVSGSPVVFNEGLRVVGHYDVGLSASSRMLYGFRSPQEAVPSPAVVYREQQKDSNFGTSLGQFEHRGDQSVRGFRNSGSRNRQSVSAAACFAEKDTPPPDQRSKFAGACSHPIKEIIIIDDSSESDTAAVQDGVRYSTEGQRETPQAFPPVIPIAAAPSYNPSRVYPISGFQPFQHHPLQGEPAAVQHSNFRGMAADPNAARWGCTPEGPGAGVEQKSSVSSSSPSSAYRLRPPAYYYSSGFS